MDPESRSASRPVAAACAATLNSRANASIGIPAPETWAFDGAVRQHHGKWHGRVAFPAEICELERQVLRAEIDLKTMCERATRLA